PALYDREKPGWIVSASTDWPSTHTSSQVFSTAFASTTSPLTGVAACATGPGLGDPTASTGMPGTVGNGDGAGTTPRTPGAGLATARGVAPASSCPTFSRIEVYWPQRYAATRPSSTRPASVTTGRKPRLGVAATSAGIGWIP